MLGYEQCGCYKLVMRRLDMVDDVPGDEWQ